ncbi:hypothetical protein N7495_006686 [Penicillium taxi]|uniref:uncharacterized protein n=1 Tax=Penicillium taxi TaxID=168475 RepID=UPI002544FCC0|nr:uncharacterized protein N7495_006686 [Penicillium taxi]KAJ5894995.1 hypothetical protein N7495_006686 [Penicillium taxi]
MGFYIGRTQAEPNGLYLPKFVGTRWATIHPPTDFRAPKLTGPPPGVDFMKRSPDSGGMDKTPPVTGKRRGGSRKACNECKQQKVTCHLCHLDSGYAKLGTPPTITAIKFSDVTLYKIPLRSVRAAVDLGSTAKLNSHLSGSPREGEKFSYRSLALHLTH